VKLPYRSGDSFALPLGNGEVVTAAIVACDHHVVEIAADEQRLRVYDEALVLHRWAPCHPERSEAKSRERLSTTALRAYARDDKVVGPAHAERIIASARGVAHFDDLPLTVYEVDDETSLARLDALPAPVMVSWSVPLAESALRRVRAWCEGRSETRLRLHSGAASQAAAFANTPLAELTLAGPFDGTVRFKSVRELVLDTPLPAIALERAFPNLRTLRIGWGARNVELMSLRGLHQLERLDLSHLELERADSLEPLSELPALRELRVARLHGLRSLAGLERMRLRTLCVEEQSQLESLVPLAACTPLEQLELLGMWQWSIEDMEWAFGLPALVRARIDIGGRRKNVELYRRARWAYPWPVFSGVCANRVGPL